MTAQESLRRHWPEYLIEAWALGTFMVSAGTFATLLDSPASLCAKLLHTSDVRCIHCGYEPSARGATAASVTSERNLSR
jgi:hypothetical protein